MIDDDPKVKCSAKVPRNLSPTYRNRLSAYRDAWVMCWCAAYPGYFGRAFYGVEGVYIAEAMKL